MKRCGFTPGQEYQRRDAFMLAKAGICDGSCDPHTGPVRVVNVHHDASGHVWKWFAYCEAAIAEDRSRGMRVEIEQELA